MKAGLGACAEWGVEEALGSNEGTNFIAPSVHDRSSDTQAPNTVTRANGNALRDEANH